MISEQKIREFFEGHIQSHSIIFLFKDEKLLEKGDFSGFARHQLKTARQNFTGFICCYLMGLFFFLAHTLNSGPGTVVELIHVALALPFLLVLSGVMYFYTKEYYTIKSSMNMILTMLDESAENVSVPGAAEEQAV